MTEVRVTLLPDGTSDRRLLRPIEWLMRQHVRNDIAVQPEWADFGALRHPPRGLSQRIARTIELYPCDILFVHRDVEREPAQRRYEEIAAAVEALTIATCPPCVEVVPVRMQESWFLFDERAIRFAAGNPNGDSPLDLPRSSLEDLPDPKGLLNELLKRASDLSGRRRQRFNVRHAAHRLADLIEDYAPLRSLPAFRRLEDRITRVVADLELG